MSRLRLDSLYRYHVPRSRIDDFLLSTEKILAEVAQDFERLVEITLEEFLLRLQAELGQSVIVSSEARFWMLESIALLLANEDDRARREEELLREFVHLLRV